MSGSSLPEPDASDLRAAARRLSSVAVVTPLLESEEIGARIGGRVLVKAECLQRTGSFKFRGAYNTIAQLVPEARRAGVVAYSSGNHAQGVAEAARLLGAPALIVMPADAPAVKIAGARRRGAEVVLYDRYRESREEIARRICDERGATLVPPFEDPRVIAGQGTVGLEIAAQAREKGVTIDHLVIGTSGGGLIAGCALALQAESPTTKIHSAEPAGFDDLRRSLEGGARVENDPGARSFCDALLAPTPGELTFRINQRLLSRGMVVTDEEVAAAVAVLFDELKLVVEPGGACALAAVLSGQQDFRERTVVVVASGGNVDRATFSSALGCAHR